MTEPEVVTPSESDEIDEPTEEPIDAPQEEEPVEIEEVVKAEVEEAKEVNEECEEMPAGTDQEEPSADEQEPLGNKAALLAQENGEESEEEIDNQEEIDMEDNSSIWGKLLAFVVVAALAFGIGYFLGNKLSSKQVIPIGASEMIEGTVTDSLLVDSTQITDSILKAKDALIKAKVDSVTRLNEARNESIRAARAKAVAEEKAAAEQKQQETVQPQPETVQPQPEPQPRELTQKEASQVLQTARSIMAHGAYNIVGTDQTITVKKGQTMQSISKTYLGSKMACYIQCHNNVAEVKEGMKLKIPKLELKKAARR